MPAVAVALVSSEVLAPVLLVELLVAPIVLVEELCSDVGDGLVSVLAVELVLLGYVLVLGSVARDVVSDELLGYALLVLEKSDDGVVLLVLGDVALVSYGELVALVVSVELEVGLVDAVVFKLPLVVSFVVLGLDVELPYVDDPLEDGL